MTEIIQMAIIVQCDADWRHYNSVYSSVDIASIVGSMDIICSGFTVNVGSMDIIGSGFTVIVGSMDIADIVGSGFTVNVGSMDIIGSGFTVIVGSMDIADIVGSGFINIVGSMVYFQPGHTCSKQKVPYVTFLGWERICYDTHRTLYKKLELHLVEEKFLVEEKLHTVHD
jgi:hypothetical protein